MQCVCLYLRQKKLEYHHFSKHSKTVCLSTKSLDTPYLICVPSDEKEAFQICSRTP